MQHQKDFNIIFQPPKLGFKSVTLDRINIYGIILLIFVKILIILDQRPLLYKAHTQIVASKINPHLQCDKSCSQIVASINFNRNHL